MPSRRKSEPNAAQLACHGALVCHGAAIVRLRLASTAGGMTAWEHLKLHVPKGKSQSIVTPDIEGKRK